MHNLEDLYNYIEEIDLEVRELKEILKKLIKLLSGTVGESGENLLKKLE